MTLSSTAFPSRVPATLAFGFCCGLVHSAPRAALFPLGSALVWTRTMVRDAFKLLAISTSLVLSGCVSPREMAARHRAACASYGFQPGTESYANCLLQLDVGDYGYGHHRGGVPLFPARHQAPAPPPPIATQD